MSVRVSADSHALSVVSGQRLAGILDLSAQGPSKATGPGFDRAFGGGLFHAQGYVERPVRYERA